ncbi:MAG: hypothetical protein SGBAC_010541 [Bacillariaceae sp.]
MFGTRGHQFLMQFTDPKENSAETETKTTKVETKSTEASDCNQRRRGGKWHHHARHHDRLHRGAPRGNCSDLPREASSPIETPDADNKKTGDNRPTVEPPAFHRFPFWGPPRRRPRPHHHNRHKNRGTTNLPVLNTETEELETSPPTSSVIQLAQQWHVQESDQSLILSIDVTGFTMENLELKVAPAEHPQHASNHTIVLTLRGKRTNGLGDVFELHRTKMIDPILYNEAGVEARRDNPTGGDSDNGNSDILWISIPKRAHAADIPIKIAEDSSARKHSYPRSEAPGKTSAIPAGRTLTAAVVGHIVENEASDNHAKATSFIPEAEIVLDSVEAAEDDEAIQNSSSVISLGTSPETLSFVGENYSQYDIISQNESLIDVDSDTEHSWEDDIVVVAVEKE